MEGTLTTGGRVLAYQAVWAHRDGDFASFTEVDGLRRQSAVLGGKGWMRMGAATTELAFEQSRTEQTVLGALLFGDSATAPRPGEKLVRRHAGVLWEVEVMQAGSDVAEAPLITFDRPDDSGPGRYGEFREDRVPSGHRIFVKGEGLLVDLARMGRFLDQALESSRATPRGPRTWSFLSFPDAEGRASIRLQQPVRLSHDPLAENLPRGAESELAAGYDVLTADYTGPWPRDESAYEPLREAARQRGLEPDGPVEHILLEDPDSAEPGRLRQRLRLPVKERH